MRPGGAVLKRRPLPTVTLTSLRDADGCAGTVQVNLAYDAQGNLDNKNGTTFDFDYGNRLRSATYDAATLESYQYDGYGRRVLQTAPGGTIQSLYSQGGQLLYQDNARTGKRTNYYYLAGSLVNEVDLDVASGTYANRYQHTDALGSPVVVTNGPHAILERNEYEPYGQVLSGGYADRPGYTGHVKDAQTGMNYMQQRYYDPMIGRFLSVDPVTAYDNPTKAFNRYWYASDNPYRFTDPDGRQSYCPGSCTPLVVIENLKNATDRLQKSFDSAIANSDIRLQADACSGGCIGLDQSLLHGDGNLSIAPVGWGRGGPSGVGQGAFLGVVFGPRNGVVINNGSKSQAEAPVALVLSGEKKAAEGLGVAVQVEANANGKTTINGGVVLGYGEVTKPVGVKLFNWNLLKKKDAE